jgi:ubiquinone biosynthesis protein COQ9
VLRASSHHQKKKLTHHHPLTHKTQHTQPSLGWTDAALAAGAADAGLSRGAAALPPRGPADLVLHFISGANDEWRGILKKRARTLSALPTPTDRLAAALRWRLELVTPHAASWPAALALLATTPGAGPAAATLLAGMVDDAWHAAGDDAAGADWYAKRAAAGAAYGAAELHMVADGSPGFEETWAFLERRVRDADAAGRAVGGLVGGVERAVTGVGGGGRGV